MCVLYAGSTSDVPTSSSTSVLYAGSTTTHVCYKLTFSCLSHTVPPVPPGFLSQAVYTNGNWKYTPTEGVDDKWDTKKWGGEGGAGPKPTKEEKAKEKAAEEEASKEGEGANG